jgi:two-component system chemotaxis sensor kinase CheA
VFSVFERKYLSEPVVNLLIHYDEVVSLTASRQQKEVAPIEFEGGDFRVMPEPLAPLAGAMVHAFRNAVDHGLETPDERVENGKPPTGKISVAFEAQEREGKRWIRVRVSDDVRGIDPEVIRAKLLGRGQQSVAQESDEQVIQHVFDAGFSTKDQVTDISGRGVGMDAIHYAVTTLGGACKVMSHPGKGTTLELDFPDPTPMS